MYRAKVLILLRNSGQKNKKVEALINKARKFWGERSIFLILHSKRAMGQKMDSSKKDTAKRYRLGIALTGGGARGFAHAGALAALEEAGHKPDIIAGVSSGSVVGALYAAGVAPKRFVELFADHKAKSFVDLRPHNGGFFSIDPFRRFIEKHLGEYKNLEDLPIPLHIGVTDFDHGVPCEFHTGNISERVVASCSIPIAFHPVKIDGVTYVDGGVLRNHPAWMIRDKCDFLIGVNVSPLDMKLKEPADSFFSVALRTYNLMAKANQNDDMALCDLNIQTPEISHYRTFDLTNIHNVFNSGYANARRALRLAGLWQNPLPEN